MKSETIKGQKVLQTTPGKFMGGVRNVVAKLKLDIGSRLI